MPRRKDPITPPAPNERPVDPNSVGGVVRSARKRLGMTQKELARRVGVDQVTISRLELGRTELPQADLFRDIGNILDIAPGKLLAMAAYPGAVLLLPDELAAALNAVPPSRYGALADFARYLSEAPLAPAERVESEEWVRRFARWYTRTRPRWGGGCDETSDQGRALNEAVYGRVS